MMEMNPLLISTLWGNYLAFVAIAVMAAGAIGLASKSMAIAVMPAYLVFAVIAIETGTTLLENILYVTVVLIIVGMSLKMWRLEGGGET